MYFFIKLQIVCFLTLLLLIAELVVDHFTHSLTLLVVAWQTLYNFLSLFISGVSLALSHNNSRELLKKVIQVNFNYRCYRICINEQQSCYSRSLNFITEYIRMAKNKCCWFYGQLNILVCSFIRNNSGIIADNTT